MTEEYRYDVIKKLVDTDGNKKNAAKKLDCTTRHINRMVKGYKSLGKAFFIHGNRGRKPVSTLPPETRKSIQDLYLTKYAEANHTHYAELLQKHEEINASPSTVRNILMDSGRLSPKARRTTKARARKALEAKRQAATSKRELDRITTELLLLDDPHPRRPRCANFGEMIQMDASVHLWFGDTKTQLHAAVDDSTGCIVGAYFDHQETLKGYYNVFRQILQNHGIPYMFYTDRRTVFEYKLKGSPSIEEDTFTQFGYACKQLGVEIVTTSIPQAKGRVERLFQTLQSRLPLELRLAGATTIEQANAFLDSYIQEYNARFALPVNHTKSVFETQPDNEKINLTLAVLANRKVDSGHSIRFDNSFYTPVTSNGFPAYYRKGTDALVIKAFDGSLFASINETVYALDLIPTHERASRNFATQDAAPAPKPKKRHVPSMSHPWKRNSFVQYVNTQPHRQDQLLDSGASV